MRHHFLSIIVRGVRIFGIGGEDEFGRLAKQRVADRPRDPFPGIGNLPGATNRDLAG